MFVIITYDVSAKRVAKVMKTCRKYLTHEQRSVFEGMITPGKLGKLKSEIEQIIDKKTDKVCVYKLDLLKYVSKEEIGIHQIKDNII